MAERKIKRYERIREKILLELLSGSFAPGMPYSSDAKLCVRFSAGRNTVRHAVQDLVEMGFLRYRRHVGITAGARCPARHSPDARKRLLFLLPDWSHNTGYLAEMKLVPLLEAGGDGREPCNVSLMLDEDLVRCTPEYCRNFNAVIVEDPGIESLKKLDELIQGGCRIITLDSKLPVRGACNLRTDTGICQDIVRELQTAGHRRIGMLCHFAGHPVNWSWISSFIRAMNETALPIQPGSLCDLRMFNAYGGEVLRNVSAIFCINRRNLETILEAAARLGLRIPEDLTVIGTDLPRVPDSRIRHIRPDLCRLADELVRWTDAGQVPEDWIGIPMELVSAEVYPDME